MSFDWLNFNISFSYLLVLFSFDPETVGVDFKLIFEEVFKKLFSFELTSSHFQSKKLFEVYTFEDTQ